MYFVESDSAIREDNKLSSFEYEHHQIQRSPLLDYGISCVKQFSLDYMHFVFLGQKNFTIYEGRPPSVSSTTVSETSEGDIIQTWKFNRNIS